MNTSGRVLGVLGLCWVGWRKSTQVQAPNSEAWRACVLGVLGLRARARMRAFFNVETDWVKILHARAFKPNTPNTLDTGIPNQLNLLISERVGFVLGRLNCVSGSSSGSFWR